MKYINYLLFFILLLCLGVLFITKDDELNYKKTKQCRIVCTTMMLADLVRNLTTEEFTVRALMGPGIDPHTYKARPSDITALLDSELIIYNGLHLEGKMGELLQELQQKKSVFCATNAIPRTMLIGSAYNDMYDPHVWHDIELWKIITHATYQILCDTFPSYKSKFTDLYEVYKYALEETAQEIALRIEKISQDRRILITAHDAFRYFGIRYNYTVLGLQGLSTESDISIKDIQNLADIIVNKHIKTIFPESCISPRNMIALQEVVTNKGGYVNVGGELFSDSLSTSNGNAPTYIKMLLYNVKTIISALEQ